MAIKDGDIIAVSGRGFVSGLINLGTFSLPGVGVSHVGIVSLYNNTPLVYETTLFDRPPCALQKRVVKGCQAHALEDWLKYVKGSVYHYPLRRELYPDEIERLQQTLDRDLGLPYDMPGAIRSGGFVYRILQGMFRREDATGLFCSEWCARALVKTGIMQTPHIGTWNPNKLVRRLVWRGICEKPKRLQ